MPDASAIASAAETTTPSEPVRSPVARMLARLGVAGFLFFLVKGLAWLAVGAAASAGLLNL